MIIGIVENGVLIVITLNQIIREKQMNGYYCMYILSLINVLCITALSLNHFLRGLEDWYLIAILLIPAILMVRCMDNIE